MLPSLIDRLGDAKDSVREQDQTLLLKIMDQAANPQVGRSVARGVPGSPHMGGLLHTERRFILI